MICFLQGDELLTEKELKTKLQGIESFRNDRVVEGGNLHNETTYREVREYRIEHHLVRLYFITRAYNQYMERILDDFRTGEPPDVLIINSCVWDLNRYVVNYSCDDRLKKPFMDYRKNLQKLFSQLNDILPPSCLIIWNTAMPLGHNVTGGFLEKGRKNIATTGDVLKANFEAATLACCYQFDVLDLNFYFRFFMDLQAKDGIHWNQFAHRRITKLLLTHVADAWGVELKSKIPLKGIAWNGNATYQHRSPQYPPVPPERQRYPQLTDANGFPFTWCNSSHDPNFQRAPFSDCENFSEEPPAHLEEMQNGRFYGPVDHVPVRELGPPSLFPVGHAPVRELGPPFPVDYGPGREWGVSHADYMPNGGQGGYPPLPSRSPRGFRGRRRNRRVIASFDRNLYSPYPRPCDRTRGHPLFGAPPYTGYRGR
ncbi:PC-esterase domain-containing protein 1A isoform X2 [Sphaerodactylus townsendi]|nr:PC-esterase domain-containing protein 1A isoform X2 [Sphaerodactylus townsendi]